MKGIIMAVVLVVMMAMSGMAAADVQNGWPMGTSNTYDGHHVMVDFEDNMSSYAPITSPTSLIEFVPAGGNSWIYASRDGQLNIFETGVYVVNGYSGAWCGWFGGSGRINFDTDVSHVSLLTSCFHPVMIDAYNDSGAKIATSGNSSSNLFSYNFSRLSIDRDESDIAYIIVHNHGNYWLIDDLIVGYEPVCTDVVISTNGSDDTVCFGMTIDFTAECTDQYGIDMECPVLTWKSSDTRVGTMNSSVFTADKKGNTTIEASYDGVISNLIDITVVPGQKMLAHCQKFIHGQGDDHWNESAYTNKTHPCNQTLYNQIV